MFFKCSFFEIGGNRVIQTVSDAEHTMKTMMINEKWMTICDEFSGRKRKT